MMRQNERGDFAIGREHVADFHAEDFEDRIAGRDDLHFVQLRLDLCELCLGLRDPHLRSFDIFFLGLDALAALSASFGDTVRASA